MLNGDEKPLKTIKGPLTVYTISVNGIQYAVRGRLGPSQVHYRGNKCITAKTGPLEVRQAVRCAVTDVFGPSQMCLVRHRCRMYVNGNLARKNRSVMVHYRGSKHTSAKTGPLGRRWSGTAPLKYECGPSQMCLVRHRCRMTLTEIWPGRTGPLWSIIEGVSTPAQKPDR